MINNSKMLKQYYVYAIYFEGKFQISYRTSSLNNFAYLTFSNFSGRMIINMKQIKNITYTHYFFHKSSKYHIECYI